MYIYEKTNDVFETHRLANSKKDTFMEVVPDRGGIITKFVVKDKPVFYLDQATLVDPNKNIRGGNPILFPICSYLKNDTYSLNGHPYTMKQHGFARNCAWNVAGVSAEEDSASITLELQDNEKTYAQYPFRFKLVYEYRLSGTTLSVNATYINQDEQPMPFYGGYHPYFQVEDKKQLEIEIPSQTFSESINNSIVQNRFNYEQDEINVFYRELSAQNCQITDPLLKRKIQVHFDPIYKYIVVWTLKGKDFLCVEPWMASTDALNSKEDLVYIQPGQEMKSHVAFEVEEL
ncbi:MAG: aldose epimerase [Bacillota bacterium]|nr:aldose epimerase [Bacillota bacterium]